jgi:hypothetical protein
MRLAPVAALLALACAQTPYDTYRAKNPAWYGEFPTVGASLHETLAGIYMPPRGDWQRLIQKVAVLRFDATGPRELSQDELDAALARDEVADYGLVVTLRCRSEYNLIRYEGEQVAWFLFHANRLAAYDSCDFAERCVVFSEFKASPAERAEQERALVAFRDAHFPHSMEHVGEFYAKGLRYLEVGRVADARAMLERGDEAFDVAERGERHVDFEGPGRKVPVAKSADVDKARDALVRALARAQGGGAPDDSASTP